MLEKIIIICFYLKDLLVQNIVKLVMFALEDSIIIVVRIVFFYDDDYLFFN